MVLADGNFTRALREFVQREDFRKLFQVTDDQRDNQKDLEYAVRLAVHTYEEFPKGRDVQEFLDQAILKVMDEKEAPDVIEQIGWSIATLYRLFGDRALIPPEDRPEGIAPRFSLRALEGIAVGLARHKTAILALATPDEFVSAKVTAFWKQPQVAEMSAKGLRGTVRLQRSVAFGSTWFDPSA
jgi:hypothetical protein